jgi:hypothetical protein
MATKKQIERKNKEEGMKKKKNSVALSPQANYTN